MQTEKEIIEKIIELQNGMDDYIDQEKYIEARIRLAQRRSLRWVLEEIE